MIDTSGSRWLGVALAVVLASAAAFGQAVDDVVTVEVRGEGISEDAARRDALRKALEQGGRVEISSRSHVENFELLRDTVFARADGLVTDYQIIEQGPAAGGVFFCSIRAKVSKSAIASGWGEVQNVLDQIGRPAITVYILERIDGEQMDSSILESQIESRLIKVGFDVKAGEQVRAIMEKELGDARSEGNDARGLAIAKGFGAQLFITGTAQANAAGVRELAGEPTAMYNGDAMIKMYYTDTAKLLASESLSNWRGGARGHHNMSPQAGKRALELAGKELVDRLYQSVMREWSTQISAGAGIELEIEGIKLSDALELRAMLREIPKVDSVEGPDFTKGIAKFRIVAKMSAADLAEHLVGEEWRGRIELVDLKLNRIQAKGRGGFSS